MDKVFEVDYLIKDAEKYKSEPHDLPQYVVALNIADAVKFAQAFEDTNLTLLKCNLLVQGRVSFASPDAKEEG